MRLIMRHANFTVLGLLLGCELFAAKVVFDKDCLPEVLALIRSAKTELVISVFDINEPEIIQAIAEARFRGVKVRVMTDRRQAMGDHSRVPDLFLLGVDIRMNSRGRLHHHKFAVADGIRSVSGSFNWTKGAHNNAEDLTVLSDGMLPSSERASIRNFQGKFEEDWTKNTRQKSDGYFRRIYKTKSGEIFERWRGWMMETLQGAPPQNKMEDGRLREAIDLADAFYDENPGLLDLVAKHARDTGPTGVRSRIAALEFMGEAETKNPEHHALILKAEHDSRPNVREAATVARVKIGGVLEGDERYDGITGSVRSAVVYCRSLFSRLP